MKIKFYNAAIMLLVFITASCVNGQTVLHSAQYANDNFTSFTPAKTYADLIRLKALTPPAYYSHPDFGKCFNDSTQWYEQIDKRTLKTRVYKGPGDEVITESAYANINYTDANGWLRAVDTKLKPALNGWAATQQETPVYLYSDGSTALALDGSNIMLFNKNVQFNHAGISATNYTVGDNGMYIKNTAPATDKIIRFGRGRIETDYTITQPLKLNGDLVISEDITLPAGYTLSENENYTSGTGDAGSLVVKGTNEQVAAELKSPFCYDKSGNSVTGAYHFQKQNGGYRLEITVPSSWLNNVSRQYPITIDPVVTGATITYAGGIIQSCIYPAFDTASIAVPIPQAATVTAIYIQGGYFTTGGVDIDQGFLSFQTSCMSNPILFDEDSTNPDNHIEGWVFLILGQVNIIHSGATHCDLPSCSAQSFRLIMGVSRDTVDTAGCNARYVYYDPTNDLGYPFAAYIVGHTLESTNANTDTAWSVSPDTLCGNSCTLTVNAPVQYGVPPYTITHPWAASSVSFGSYSSATGASTGDTSLILTIPNCPDTFTVVTTISVRPPTITDACGDTATGLTAKQITINPAPHATFGYVVNGYTVTFSDSSARAKSWKWEFGDGDTSTQENPMHTYSPGKDYIVTLLVTNGTCTDSLSESIDITTGIAGVTAQPAAVRIYPNPASNAATVEFVSSTPSAQLTLVNVLGQTLYSKTLAPAVNTTYRANLDVSQLPVGIYEVVITTPQQSMAKEIIKQE